MCKKKKTTKNQKTKQNNKGKNKSKKSLVNSGKSSSNGLDFTVALH